MPYSIAIALGSNLGDRARNLREAVRELTKIIGVVRLSTIRETEPVDAPPPNFLNMVITGHTSLSPEALLEKLQAIENRLGRRRGIRNAPRTIDLDLIFHSANVRRSKALTLPHPRYRERAFVIEPLREVWVSDYRVPKLPPPSMTWARATATGSAPFRRG